MKGYLANGLFNLADRNLNELLAKEIRKVVPNVDLYVPQENAEVNDKNSFADSIMIFNADTEKLLESDFLIAVIDGETIDSGVATEIGIFTRTLRPIFALYTDVRQHGRTNIAKLEALIDDATECQFFYKNLFVVGAIKNNGKIFSEIGTLTQELKEWCENN